ncbi:hypothetical protein EV182_003750, partial [Spiromyces aspiralis]
TLEARVTGSKIIIGLSSWPESIKDKWLLVDKSFILPRVIEDDDPILVARPCSFGKTMFLSMAEDFFGVPRNETLEDKQARYRDMMVGAIPGFIDEHCGRYPVIRLDLKANRLLWRFPETQEGLDASKWGLLSLKERLNREWPYMKTDITTCTGILKSLVEFFNAYHGRKCILLIDEFDAPILAANEDNRGTIEKHIRDMLAPVVKTTEGLLSRCVMVSVNPINLGDLDSGLNNFTVLSLHYASMKSYPKDILMHKDLPYQVAFGFTEDEVRKLIATRVFPDNEAMVDVALNVARDWYGGYYVFKNFCIYNPWSVMKFIKALTEGKPCSNEAEVLAKAHTEILKKIYYELKKINPSIFCVIIHMYYDYFNLKNKNSNLENKDSTKPSTLRTSIQVDLTNAHIEQCIAQNDAQRFEEHTKEITVDIATLNWDAQAENPTLDKFMTMAYYSAT